MNDIILSNIQNTNILPELLMKFVSNLGHGEFYLFVMILIMWCINYKKGAYFAIIVAFTTLSTEGIKIVFQQSRPYTEGIKDQDFGMPSAHASTAIVFFGMLSTWIKNHFFTTMSILMIVLIGLSRVYLNEHFPSQVLIGYILGLVVLLFAKKFDHQHLVKISLFVILVTTISLFISIIMDVGKDNLKHVMQVSGLLLGLLGALYLNRHKKITVKGSVASLLIKIVVLLMMLCVFLGMKYLMDKYIGDYLLYIFANFPLHLLLAFSLSYWIPNLFSKFGIMQIERI